MMRIAVFEGNRSEMRSTPFGTATRTLHEFKNKFQGSGFGDILIQEHSSFHAAEYDGPSVCGPPQTVGPVKGVGFRVDGYYGRPYPFGRDAYWGGSMVVQRRFRLSTELDGAEGSNM